MKKKNIRKNVLSYVILIVVILGITPFNIVKGIVISAIGVLGFRSIGKLIK